MTPEEKLPTEETPEPKLPVPIEVNELVKVYDETRAQWYNARWNIFTVGEVNLFAAISIDSAGTFSIVQGAAGKRMLITSITITVDDECNIAFLGSFGPISGTMDFGGENEPRGMTLNLGNFYIELPEGSGFSISVSDTVHVGGLITYVLR